MRDSSRLRLVLALAFVPVSLLACNAIIGIEDVKLRASVTDAGTDAGTDPFAGKSQLALGFGHGCALLPDRTVRCWGDNLNGAVGDGKPIDGTQKDVLKPQPVPGIADAVWIAAGVSHSCVVRATGRVSCWGSNLFGQLGDGTQQSSSAPVDVVEMEDAKSVAGGTSFTCALRKDKTVACWGANHAGQLGDGRKVDRPKPAPVTGLNGVLTISAANDHACAVLETGEVMCWGGNTHGQLGIGSRAESLSPSKVEPLANIAQVAAASHFSCARRKTGRVDCWGSNELGQLGNGASSSTASLSPVTVPSIDDATFLWAGFEHACVTRKAGKVTCWGSAGEGQVGNGAIEAAGSISPPVAVVDAPAAIAVWTGGNRSCAVAEDGRAFCWGQNTNGQLGDGTTKSAYVAVPVTALP
ncbi:MAG TPA: hypothetical protein VM925_22070 [Labilithrix sp.]|nr:hypothetical protein [Labilithrix sp.]